MMSWLIECIILFLKAFLGFFIFTFTVGAIVTLCEFISEAVRERNG